MEMQEIFGGSLLFRVALEKLSKKSLTKYNNGNIL